MCNAGLTSITTLSTEAHGQQKSFKVLGISFGPKNAQIEVKRWYLKEKLKNAVSADTWWTLGWQSPASGGINHWVRGSSPCWGAKIQSAGFSGSYLTQDPVG
jgi:hypothetical protein